MKPVGFFQFLFSSCQLGVGVGCLVSLSLIRSLPPHFAGHCDAVAAAAASLLMMESRCVCVCVILLLLPPPPFHFHTTTQMSLEEGEEREDDCGLFVRPRPLVQIHKTRILDWPDKRASLLSSIRIERQKH